MRPIVPQNDPLATHLLPSQREVLTTGGSFPLARGKENRRGASWADLRIPRRSGGLTPSTRRVLTQGEGEVELEWFPLPIAWSCG